ncbi:MAG: hypothetical protein GY696_19245, partial [Gammaproteobacteria bacterium]|nr:hypothetical protein [Gammaproteobacteria bacterium]
TQELECDVCRHDLESVRNGLVWSGCGGRKGEESSRRWQHRSALLALVPAIAGGLISELLVGKLQ